MLGVFLSTCVQDHFFCIPHYSTWRAALHRPLFSLDPFLQRSVTPHQSRLHNLCKIKDMISVSSTVLLCQGGVGEVLQNVKLISLQLAQKSCIDSISAMALYDRNSKSRIRLVFSSRFSQDLILSFILIASLHNFSGSYEFLSTKLKTTFNYVIIACKSD